MLTQYGELQTVNSIDWRRASTSSKCRPADWLFSNAESSRVNVSTSKIKLTFATYLSVTYFHFQFPLFVYFYSMSERELN